MRDIYARSDVDKALEMGRKGRANHGTDLPSETAKPDSRPVNFYLSRIALTKCPNGRNKLVQVQTRTRGAKS